MPSDLPPGAVSKRFIEHLRLGLESIQPRMELAFSEGYAGADTEWDRWVATQPQRERAYLRSIRAEGRWYAIAAFLNGLDHSHALADSLKIQEHGVVRAWSYLTLSRTGCEAFIRCAAIADASRQADQKAGISAAIVLWGNLEQAKLSRSNSDLNAPEAAKQLRAFEKKLERAGFTIRKDSKGRVSSIARAHVRTNLELDVTRETDARISDLPSPYRFGSAVAHSGAWFLGSSIEVRDDVPSLVASPDLMLIAVSSVLFANLAAVESVSDGDNQHVSRLRVELRGWLDRAALISRNDHDRR